jgi:hypothetical protein
MSLDASHLPACSKCRVRKVRCDRQAPKCGNCTKGNVACIIVDVITGEQYARDYIQQLENEEARLKAQAGYRTSSNGSGPQHTGPADSTPRGPPTAETIASHSGFVGDGSGLGQVSIWLPHKLLTSQVPASHLIRGQMAATSGPDTGTACRPAQGLQASNHASRVSTFA